MLFVALPIMLGTGFQSLFYFIYFRSYYDSLISKWKEIN